MNFECKIDPEQANSAINLLRRTDFAFKNGRPINGARCRKPRGPGERSKKRQQP